jgi:cell division protein ZipA
MEDFIIISVIAKPNQPFASYDLLQTISATGMQFGAMNIFHYYSPFTMDKKPLFSLASATEPGEFDLNQIGNFSCRGLTLFMNLHQPDKMNAFTLMLETAEQLAEDLQGELRTAHREPWTNEIKQRYLDKILKSVDTSVML